MDERQSKTRKNNKSKIKPESVKATKSSNIKSKKNGKKSNQKTKSRNGTKQKTDFKSSLKEPIQLNSDGEQIIVLDPCEILDHYEDDEMDSDPGSIDMGQYDDDESIDLDHNPESLNCSSLDQSYDERQMDIIKGGWDEPDDPGSGCQVMITQPTGTQRICPVVGCGKEYRVNNLRNHFVRRHPDLNPLDYGFRRKHSDPKPKGSRPCPCPVPGCGKLLKKKSFWGHWKSCHAGLKRSDFMFVRQKAPTTDPVQDTVVCPLPGCGQVVKRGSTSWHRKTKHGSYTKNELKMLKRSGTEDPSDNYRIGCPVPGCGSFLKTSSIASHWRLQHIHLKKADYVWPKQKRLSNKDKPENQPKSSTPSPKPSSILNTEIVTTHTKEPPPKQEEEAELNIHKVKTSKELLTGSAKDNDCSSDQSIKRKSENKWNLSVQEKISCPCNM